MNETPPQGAQRPAVSQRSKQNNSSFLGCGWKSQRNEWIVFADAESLVCWVWFSSLWLVMGGATRQCSAKKKDKRKQTNSTTQFFFIQFILFFSLFSLSICGLWAGGPANAPQRKRKQKRRERLSWFINERWNEFKWGACLLWGLPALALLRP